MTRYNSMFNQWETMSPMPEAVLHPAVAAADHRIYVFGGENAMQNPVRMIQVIPQSTPSLSFQVFGYSAHFEFMSNVPPTFKFSLYPSLIYLPICPLAYYLSYI